MFIETNSSCVSLVWSLWAGLTLCFLKLCLTSWLQDYIYPHVAFPRWLFHNLLSRNFYPCFLPVFIRKFRWHNTSLVARATALHSNLQDTWGRCLGTQSKRHIHSFLLRRAGLLRLPDRHQESRRQWTDLWGEGPCTQDWTGSRNRLCVGGNHKITATSVGTYRFLYHTNVTFKVISICHLKLPPRLCVNSKF